MLRERIIGLGEEEQCPYERPFLQRHLLRALSVGIRDNNIRFDLKEVFANPQVTDEELLLKAITEAANREKERLSRLGLKEAVSVAAITHNTPTHTPTAAEVKTLEAKKKRENKMQAQINELQVKSEKHERKLAEMEETSGLRHAEIMSVLTAKNTSGGGSGGYQQGGRVSKSAKGFSFKCQECKDNNRPRCSHCFKCCKSGHRVADCPEDSEEEN